ncbi:hypothetical protein PVAP13_3KG167800 [Panicum virgatum]|uniref:F-box domain-containing protein n=1 Tax=Panicum virgatum TaxID=38727 RepID=A0A8T0UXE5_PANVG|nr:hypothetical protein PVAP13_3KG167800 [Panicum virgatum]
MANQPQEPQHPNLRQRSDISNNNWRDWASGLPQEMRALIAERAMDTDEKDLIRFRAVCSAWRDSIGGENRINRSIHPRRWILLLPEDRDAATLRKFGNIATGECIHLQDLHQLADHSVAEGPHANPEGMLVLRDDTSFVIRLFNPLTRQLTDLPSLKTLLAGGEGDDDQMSDEEFGELHEEITTMEEELKTKSKLIAKHKKLIEGWRKELKEQLGKHITELERV